MLKHLLAAAMIFSMTSFANAQPTEIRAGGEMTAQANQYYRYDFGQVRTGFSAYADFYLSNTGSGVLDVYRIATAGRDFRATHYCPSVLFPGQRCTISVQFAPWDDGFSTGRLYLDTNNGLITVDLSGWGRRF